MPVNELIRKIAHKEAKVGVIGLGYVGLPLAFEFANVGFNVVGIDTDPTKVEAINKGNCYIKDIPTDAFKLLVKNKKLKATTDFSTISELDTLSICVPTPLRKTRDPDMSYILAVANELKKFIRAGQLIVLESTTYPGTTEEIILPILTNGLKVGENIGLAFSPERIDPGNQQFSLKNTPKVVGGVTPKCAEIAQKLYSFVSDKVVLVSSPRVAEMVKLLENTFRLVNIALINEIGMMCQKIGVNVWEVIEAAASKPFGFMPFYPGPGLGGHCIPVDPHYLSWKLKAHNFNARFIDLAADINMSMPRYIVDRVTTLLNERKRVINGSRLLILGLSYKRDVGDLRESPSLEVIQLLKEKNADLVYHDHFIDSSQIKELELTAIPLDKDQLKNIDAAILLTDHTDFPYKLIHDCVPFVFDTRNIFYKYVGKSNKVYTI